jgi:NADH-quinone oxidoreductase subunit N
MMVMVSANHLLMIFLGMEMASLPSYALAGFLKGRRRGSEAALKYVVYGAASSGVALYGISLLTAQFGTGDLPRVAAGYAAVLQGGGFTPALAAGTLLFLVGLGFKLAAVPFHWWLPDVFEGAAAEVGAFLSVASKAAAVGLTARFLLTLQGAADDFDPTILPRTVGVGVLVAAAVTATLGNLAALAQTNLKRLLGYSTVAHAGYMMMALATFTRTGAAAVLFYLAAYLLMNLGAFAVVAIIRNRTGAETIDACRGLLGRSPALTVGLAAFLLSLLGIPPLAGFAGKFQVFAAVYEAGRDYSRLGQPDLGTAFYVLLGVGVVNTVLSAGYYLRVLRSASLDDAAETDEKGEPAALGESWEAAVYVALLAVALVVVGVWWGPLTDLTVRAVGRM